MNLTSNPQYSPSFRAIKIAETRNVINGAVTKLDVYQVSHRDKSFLHTLCDTTDMKKLMPGLEKDEYRRWHEMLEIATDKAESTDRKSFVIAQDKHPCGIITFKPGKNIFALDCICTWPIEFGKKVNLAGQTLFKMMFEDFSKTKANKIRLEAITDGPYPTEPKYTKLGFKAIGSRDDNKIEMEISSNNVRNSLNNLKNKIQQTNIQDSETVNLCDEFDI